MPKVSLHPDWDSLSEEKKDLFCAMYQIDREGTPLEEKGIHGPDPDYETVSGPGWMMTFKKEKK